MRMIYIMVTNWRGHWDNLKNNTTLYTFPMMRDGMDRSKIKEHTKTFFIKRHKQTRVLEKCWTGVTSDFVVGEHGGKEAIYFRVGSLKAIPCPEKYRNHFEGWYFDHEDLEEDMGTEEDSRLHPRFFFDLETTTDWLRFEEYIYWLLKCLGIHNSHRFNPNKQKGKADGFFKFGGFAVLYDCTLDPSFESSKEVQIQNFCDQLQKGAIEYEGKRVNVRDCSKNVWIITKGSSQRLIKQIDDVFVKEVPVFRLMKLYRDRIIKDLDETTLEQELRNL
jgi:hypothetical protein